MKAFHGMGFDGVQRRFHFGSVLWITFIWVMLMGQLTRANVIAGVIIGLVIVLGLPLPSMPLASAHIRWGAFAKLMLGWLWDLLKASVKVAWLALRRADPPQTAIIKVPMRVQSDIVLAFATTLFNLQPGGSVTDIDIGNRMLTVHLLDAGTPEALAQEIENVAKLERDLIHIFERN